MWVRFPLRVRRLVFSVLFMKKLFSILAIAAMLFLASACRNNNEKQEVVDDAVIEAVDSLEVAVDSTATVALEDVVEEAE